MNVRSCAGWAVLGPPVSSVALMLVHYDMPAALAVASDTINIFCTAGFILEAVMKLIALGVFVFITVAVVCSSLLSHSVCHPC